MPVCKSHSRRWMQCGFAACAVIALGAPGGAPRETAKPFAVYHDGATFLFAPEGTGTHRWAKIGPWNLGERLPPTEEKLLEKRLNLYVVIPGSQHHSADHPEYDHNLVVNKFPVDR